LTLRYPDRGSGQHTSQKHRKYPLRPGFCLPN